MINERLSRLFREQGVKPEVVPHREAFTSQEVAQTTHVSGRMFAKAVVLRDSASSYLMAVLPATEHVSLQVIHGITGRHGLVLATEEELKRLFPDCELGAMPPFGALYGMSTLVDPCLAGNDIYFQAGNHHEVARLPYATYVRLARPVDTGDCLHTQAHVYG